MAEGGDITRAGTVQGGTTLAVRAHGNHPRPVGLIGARVEQGLQVGAGPRNEHDQARLHAVTITGRGPAPVTACLVWAAPVTACLVWAAPVTTCLVRAAPVTTCLVRAAPVSTRL